VKRFEVAVLEVYTSHWISVELSSHIRVLYTARLETRIKEFTVHANITYLQNVK